MTESLEDIQARKSMIEEQLIPRGIKDRETLKSMSKVPRHMFVPKTLQKHAYEDGPMQIGFGQTISQPYIVALMTQSAKITSESRVLEIGTGSGYAAAILSQIAKEVYTVERIPELANHAIEMFQTLGYKNISVKISNGTLGWAEKGPFDAILVTAGGPTIPESLLEQLKPGGSIVIPVGDLHTQELVRMTKTLEGKPSIENLGAVRFVPLIGEEGWLRD
jgi:protein-L-isoaspartate(D-aspartate) O-methyltransferase